MKSEDQFVYNLPYYRLCIYLIRSLDNEFGAEIYNINKAKFYCITSVCSMLGQFQSYQILIKQKEIAFNQEQYKFALAIKLINWELVCVLIC